MFGVKSTVFIRFHVEGSETERKKRIVLRGKGDYWVVVSRSFMISLQRNLVLSQQKADSVYYSSRYQWCHVWFYDSEPQ